MLSFGPNECMSSFLNQHVLVLNRLWQAVNVCTARRALTLLFEGHAQVVLSDAEGVFQTFSFSQWRDFFGQGTPVREKGVDPGARHPPRPGRPYDVGEHCLLVRAMQHSKGQSDASGGCNA